MPELKTAVCSKCLTKVKRGIHHQCTPGAFIDNVENVLAEKWSSKTAEQLTSNMLKNSTLQKMDSNGGIIQLSQMRGRLLPVIVKPEQSQKNQQSNVISADAIRKMQTDLNLSGNQTKTINSFLIKSFGSRKILEKNVQKKISQFTHVLDDYFECCSFEFTNEKNDKIEIICQKAVVCKDLEKFINFIVDHRKYNDYHLKFGLDGGGKFLKFCLSIQSTVIGDILNNAHKKKPSSNKDGGVKKLFIIAIAPSIQENYHNIKILWNKLGINRFLNADKDGTITTDLKVANVLMGLMNHASCYPCTWCISNKTHLECVGEPRTLEQCFDNYEKFSTENDKKKAKLFKNCVNMPIINCDKQAVLDIIPPPELHLLIGSVNHLYDHMLKKFPEIATEWAKQCYVYRVDVYRGKLGFQGNQCKKLLNNVDSLEKLFAANQTIGLEYVDAYKKLLNVVNSCFTNILQDDYKTSLDEFKESFQKLKIPVTPKIHAIFFHVEEFCLSHGLGLGFFNEQAFESVHHDYSQTWTKYKVMMDNPKYGERLLRSIAVYNCDDL